MPARVQQLILGLGKAKQSNITTASASFIRFTKLNSDLTSTGFSVEDDAPEIGKGDEFASNIFPVAYSPANHLDKYSSAEFVTYCCAFGLGNVAEAAGVYTITPLNPGTTLELPYFTVVEQVAEGGGSAIDNAFIGCAMEGFVYSFNYGPGRQSGRMSANWVGSGKITSPSGVSVPAVQTESNMLSASMALTVNGVDYVAAKTILSGSIGWQNNMLLGPGFFPGSGTQNGGAIRGRIEIGNRNISFSFTARLLASSAEYAKLIALTTGTAVLTITFDATHTVTFTLQKIAFEVVSNTEADGLVAVTVTAKPMTHPSNGLISVSAKCGVSGIAQ